MNAELLVFVDESGSNLAMTRLYAWAPKGERAFAAVPKNRGRNTTILGALTSEGFQASMTLEGAADRLAFEVFIEHYLLPTLSAAHAATEPDHCVGQPLHPQGRACVSWSRLPAVRFCSCPPTRRTSTPSNWRGASSRASYERQAPEPARNLNTPLDKDSLPSQPKTPRIGVGTVAINSSDVCLRSNKTSLTSP